MRFPSVLAPSLAALLAASAARCQEPWGPGESEIVFSEIHYHPAEDESKGEFIELHNAGVHTVDLGGWTFTSGIEMRLADGTGIEPGGYLVVARDAAAMAAQEPGARIVGDYKGGLANTGDIIELRTRTGRLGAWIHYGDGGSHGDVWPSRADGEGSSLELIDPSSDWHRGWSWGASRVAGGTPGRPNSRSAAVDAGDPVPGGGLRLNEARLEGEAPFVELWNDGETAVKLDGILITRDPRGAGGVTLVGSLAKKKTHVVSGDAARGLVGGRGSLLFLLGGPGRAIIDTLPARNGGPPEGSLGRFPDGDRDVVALPRATPGAANAAPPPAPVVISEILYHGRTDKKDEEFVELQNRGKTAVPLAGWRLARGVDFKFPDDATLAPGGAIAVAGVPAKLRARLRPEESKLVLGPFDGNLSDSGESVALLDASGVVVDRVEYGDNPPWPSGADGAGFSLELVHLDLDNRFPQAWALGPAGGTPCRPNQKGAKDVPPAIARVRHEPAVPTPEDAPLIHAHVIDTGKVSEVAVIYHDAAVRSKAVKKALADAGTSEDGAAKDGHYAARLPRFRAGSVIGFYVQAKDASGKVVRWPEGDRECHFQVEPKDRSSGELGGPVYRVIMPGETWQRFSGPGRDKSTFYPCTLIASFEGKGVNPEEGHIFYNAAIRHRGSNSFMAPDEGRMSYRLRLAPGDTLDGRDRLILNGSSPLRQKLGGELLRAAGLPAPDVTLVRLKTPTADDEHYVDVEVVDSNFLRRHFGSSKGDVYRGQRGRPYSADLAYHGPEVENYETAYVRGNKKRQDADYAPLIAMLEALSTKDAAEYARKVEAAIDVQEWAAYFALNHVLGNDENGLSKGVAEDYFIARRPGDGRFILVPWDQDTIFGRDPQEPLYPNSLPSVRRLLQEPRFAPHYHRAAREALDGPLSPASLHRRLRRLGQRFPEAALQGIQVYLDRRQVALRQRYVRWPQAGVERGQGEPSGWGTKVFAGAGADQGILSGFADPAAVFGVRVGGQAARFDGVSGRWTAALGAAAQGTGPLWVELLGGMEESCGAFAINVVRGRAPRRVSQGLEGKQEWQAAEGPFLLEGTVVVGPGATLRIGPGVDVICMPQSSLEVRGTLLVEGTPQEPVTFRPAGPGSNWMGITLATQGGGDAVRHIVRCCRFEGGSARAALGGGEPLGQGLEACFLRVAGGGVELDRCVFRGIAAAAVGAERCTLQLSRAVISDCRAGVFVRSGRVVVDGLELSDLLEDGLRVAALSKDDSSVVDLTCRNVFGAGLAADGCALAVRSFLAVRCGVGLLLTGGARVKLEHATVAENATGIALDPARTVVKSRRGSQPAPASGKSSLELAASVLGAHDQVFSLGQGSRVKVEATAAAPFGISSTVSDTGLKWEAPRFRAPLKGDYRLSSGSPGAGAATGKDWGFVWPETVSK